MPAAKKAARKRANPHSKANLKIKPCSVCTHAQVDRINHLLRCNALQTTVAKDFGLSHWAVHRHLRRNHVELRVAILQDIEIFIDLDAPKAARECVRVAALMLKKIIDKGEGDIKEGLRAIEVLMDAVRLAAQLTGKLNPQPGTNVANDHEIKEATIKLEKLLAEHELKAPSPPAETLN